MHEWKWITNIGAFSREQRRAHWVAQLATTPASKLQIKYFYVLHATPNLNTTTMKQFLLIGTSLAHRDPFGSLKINIAATGHINKGGQNHLQVLYQCKTTTTIHFKQQNLIIGTNLARKVGKPPAMIYLQAASQDLQLRCTVMSTLS